MFTSCEGKFLMNAKKYPVNCYDAKDVTLYWEEPELLGEPEERRVKLIISPSLWRLGQRCNYMYSWGEVCAEYKEYAPAIRLAALLSKLLELVHLAPNTENKNEVIREFLKIREIWAEGEKDINLRRVFSRALNGSGNDGWPPPNYGSAE